MARKIDAIETGNPAPVMTLVRDVLSIAFG
jgi:hypothetical protein